SFVFLCRSLSLFFFFSSRRRHTRSKRDWSSDVCSSDLDAEVGSSSSAEAITADDSVAPADTDEAADLTTEERVASLLVSERRLRSEERRVGKACRARGAGCEQKEDEKVHAGTTRKRGET